MDDLPFPHETPRPPDRNWWGRNWKWFVPVIILTPIFVCGGGLVLLLAAIMGMVKGTGAYEEALLAAKLNTDVRAALGTPVEDGFLVMGNIELQPGSGWADLAIPISGPDASGVIVVEAEKTGREWGFHTLEVLVNGETIDLLE